MSGSKSLRSSFFAALIGACGVGMQLAHTIHRYRNSHDPADLPMDILLGVIFLAIAVVNSARVLPRLHDPKRPT